jgi:hypothetical protein
MVHLPSSHVLAAVVTLLAIVLLGKKAQANDHACKRLTSSIMIC